MFTNDELHSVIGSGKIYCFSCCRDESQKAHCDSKESSRAWRLLRGMAAGANELNRKCDEQKQLLEKPRADEANFQEDLGSFGAVFLSGRWKS